MASREERQTESDALFICHAIERGPGIGANSKFDAGSSMRSPDILYKKIYSSSPHFTSVFIFSMRGKQPRKLREHSPLGCFTQDRHVHDMKHLSLSSEKMKCYQQ
ncbi:hypothetical protein Bind_0781 [Beijerinckia indica subsp. indica ATCC 9039]|uniref:Uncharacterized protein n=1 Tax=Beijerinckia indica subsp. indica (strain ATCC 9039 / DSM 1715 / NCIMB 8712) TaxID=395963 RepID=B2IH17_BEII9|nr:hypothetical protein Bind_0781 [Beijerinckia indica subsp. indica ATCC 9039]